MVLEAIKYSTGELEILNQLKLPHEEVYDKIRSPEDAWHAIKSMRVRGAPAIAMVAILSLAVHCDMLLKEFPSRPGMEDQVLPAWYISHNLKYLVTSRPTAVNLYDAAKKLETIVYAASELSKADGRTIMVKYIQAAERMLANDVADNKNIGTYGAKWILKANRTQSPDYRVSVLTHCNTG